ncbi:MAG: dihydropteroate synthase [Cytophagales bacterium]|nr:dihydropteroate synthase [Armatimonadota bacterium]
MPHPAGATFSTTDPTGQTVPLLQNILPDLGKRTLIMGVLNVTPDSFSDGGQFVSIDSAVERARQMQREGADLLDIGGESTRPGAVPVSEDEESRRVLPVITRIAAEVGLPISLDTTKARVARAGIAAGAAILNDISAGTMDREMLAVAAEREIPIALMHLPVPPAQMGWSQAAALKEEASDTDVIETVVAFLRERVAAARTAGIALENIMIDPGFGFGKSVPQNLELLRRLSEIKRRLGGLPLLLGTSRKSTIARLLGPARDAEDPQRVAGTAATIALGIAQGADIVRVHDVGFMARVARISDAITR